MNVPRLSALAAVVLFIAGCTGEPGGGPILANAPIVRPSPAATPTPTPRPPDPVPIVFPRDDGPHDRLTEWWYYTGHLRDRASGARYGFEFVVFRAERGDFPIAWASHLAITDEGGDRFFYAQRSEIGPQVDGSPRGPDGQPRGFALTIDATGGNSSDRWAMAGADGTDTLSATMTATEAAAAGSPAGLGLQLALASLNPPTLHGAHGFVDFGAAGGSYYYSRTRMAANGSIVIDGRTLDVSGEAWFDHQWGDFIAVGGGGWDWFAVNLADGTDLILSLVRDSSGGYPLVYGTAVAPGGTVTHLNASDFSVAVTARWTSPRTGTVYPAGWRIDVPGLALRIDLRPTVADQELDTRATTGVVYWEGSQVVEAQRAGRPLGGEAYVELTGYGP